MPEVSTQAPLLQRVAVNGYKSANDEIAIDFKRLTLLAGQNSAGKSTIIQPLLLLKQTIEKTYDPGPLAIDGPFVQFSAANQMFSRTKNKKNNRKDMKIDIRIGSQQKDAVRDITFNYVFRQNTGINLESVGYVDEGNFITWREGEIFTISDKKFPSEYREFARKQSHAQFVVRRDRAFLVGQLQLPLRGKSGQISESFNVATRNISGNLSNVLRRLIYLPGLRGNPERNYRIVGDNRFFPGFFHEYTATVLHDWRRKKDRHKLQEVGEDLLHLGLTWKIDTKKIDDTKIEILVGRTPKSQHGGANDLVSVADVGLGVSQVLPVVVALIAAEPEQIVYIEQPEIHLHPRAQVALAGIIFKAVRRGVQVVIETHSSSMVRAMQSLVAQGAIPHELISLNWFTRDENGQTHIKKGALDEGGRYGDWPVDFIDVELEVEGQYLDALDRIEAAKENDL